MKYDLGGTNVWDDFYQRTTSTSYNHYPYEIKVDYYGNIHVTGAIYLDEILPDDAVYTTIMYDSGGDMIILNGQNNTLNTGMPSDFILHNNYPNPFNPSTDIKFELPQNTYVTVKVYNAVGVEVALLVNNEWKSTGRYSVKFDGSNLASGIYFYTIDAGSFRDTKKMVLIK